jgi:hypothetical protein
MSSLFLFRLTADIRIASREREKQPEAEFLDVIGTKVLEFSSLLFKVTSTSTKRNLTPPLPPSQTSLKLDCNVNIVYGNLKSDVTRCVNTSTYFFQNILV